MNIFKKLTVLAITLFITLCGTAFVFADSESSEKINVTIKVMGDDAHGTSPHTDYSLWIKKEISVDTGTSVKDAVLKVLDENGFTYEAIDSEYGSYLESITNPLGTKLASFTNGSGSGWMYKVNGIDAWVSFNEYILSNNDTVMFYYNDDWQVTWGIYGDVDGDYEITLNDAALLLDYILKENTSVLTQFADINKDSIINAYDVSQIKEKALNSDFKYYVQ